MTEPPSAAPGAANATRTALITGISGQDGAYLARFLLSKGYRVFGTSRDAGQMRAGGLERLGVAREVTLLSMAPNDFKSTITAIARARPDEIYHLAGQSSVSLSFEQPSETIESVTIGSLNILEAIRFLGLPARFCHTTSSDCFGDTRGVAANENTPFDPVSPYAVSKAAAHWLVRNYRQAHGMFAANGILFNHESALRPPHFVTRKVVQAACRIAQGSKEKLLLGDLRIVRDWGWAPEYVEAMWKILQADAPDDFVIATGESHSLQEFVAAVFTCLDLDWTRHVAHDGALRRPNEIASSHADPSKALKVLGWKAQARMADVVKSLVAAETAEGVKT